MRKHISDKKWELAAFSLIGSRERNEDRLVHFVEWADSKTPVSIFIACDGVGGESGGAECAEEVIKAAWLKIKHLLSDHGIALLKKTRGALLARELKNLTINGSVSGATTLVVLLFSIRRFRNGYRSAVAWAGDSRAHIVDIDGKYIQLTRDHHDEEERLTAAYVAKNGNCEGDVEVRHFLMPQCPLAFGVTTDGVHGKCTEEEFRSFLAWCLLQKKLDNDIFAKAAEKFLNKNISDNLSAVFLMKRFAIPESTLRGILEKWRVANV